MVVKTDPEDSERQNKTEQAIYLFIKGAAQDISIEKIKEIVSTIEQEGLLKKLEMGSIRFIIRFYSQESLDKFNERCLSGELAGELTAHLITVDDIRKVSGMEMKIHLIIEDTDYREAQRILHQSDLSGGETSQTKSREEENKWAFGLRKLKKLKYLKLKNVSLNGNGLEKVAKSVMQLADFIELDVSGNPLGGSASDWSSYLRTMTKLNKLDFSACELTRRDAKSIVLMTQDKFELQLNLSSNTELGSSTENWMEPFCGTEKLNKLNLSKCNVKSSKVGEILSKFQNVGELDLSSNRLGGSLGLWNPALKKVNKLVLRSCGLTGKDLLYIDAAVQELDVSGNHGIGINAVSASLPKDLKKLDMSDCCLYSEALDQYVTNAASLVDINLSKNKDIITSALSKTMKKLKILQKLSLSGCSLTGEFMEDIICACLQLIELDISDNEGLRGTLSSWLGKVEKVTNLHGLNLGSCNLASDDVEQIYTNAANFKELILSGNRDIGRKNLTKAADMYGLNALDLSDCMLQKDFMVHFLMHRHRLVKLVIAKNHSLGGTFDSWAKNLSRSENLSELNLSYSSLTEGDADPLAEAVKTMQSFKELCIAGNAEIGKSIHWLVKLREMKLKKLDISDCSLKEMGIRVFLDYQDLGDRGQLKREQIDFQSQLEELDISFHPDLGDALISHTGTI